MKITESSRTRLRRLLKAFEGHRRVLVLSHDYADPDAIAAALNEAARGTKGRELGTGLAGRHDWARAAAETIAVYRAVAT